MFAILFLEPTSGTSYRSQIRYDAKESLTWTQNSKAEWSA